MRCEGGAMREEGRGEEVSYWFKSVSGSLENIRIRIRQNDPNPKATNLVFSFTIIKIEVYTLSAYLTTTPPPSPSS